ncbi:MAG: YrhK family protein [Pseudomonadota bacterium]
MLFQSGNRYDDAEQTRVYALFEIAHTIASFLAAVLFIIGSILFFYEDLQHTGTWLFLIGSIFFAIKPTLTLIRELKLAAMGDRENLADRMQF